MEHRVISRDTVGHVFAYIASYPGQVTWIKSDSLFCHTGHISCLPEGDTLDLLDLFAVLLNDWL